MMLTNLEKGQKARVLQITNGNQLTRRLYEMGIMPGSELEIVSRHPFRGPLVMKTGNTVLAMGRSMAGLVEVEQI